MLVAIILFLTFLGLGDYEGFRCELYKDTDLFIVCFDIGNPRSLENVQEVVSVKINFYIMGFTSL